MEREKLEMLEKKGITNFKNMSEILDKFEHHQRIGKGMPVDS